MKKIQNIILIAVIFVVIGVLVLLALSMRKEKLVNNPGTVGNLAGNLYNGGYFCEDGEDIYFIYGKDNHDVYQMKADGSITKTKLNAAFDLNIANGYLYYRRDNSGNAQRSFLDGYAYGVYRVNLREKTLKNVSLTIEQVENLCLLGNNLYYNSIDGDDVYLSKMDINAEQMDKEDRVTHLEKAWNDVACAVDSWLYYSDMQGDHKVYRIHAENGTRELFFDGNCYQPIFDGTYLYYIDLDDAYALKRRNMQTQETTTIVKSNCVNYNTDGTSVFYEWEDGANKDYGLFRCNVDGTNAVRLTNQACMNINITSDYTYFMYFNEDGNWYRVATNGNGPIEPFLIEDVQ